MGSGRICGSDVIDDGLIDWIDDACMHAFPGPERSRFEAALCLLD